MTKRTTAEIDRLRAALAACERERDEALFDADASGALALQREDERDAALSEVERLRAEYKRLTWERDEAIQRGLGFIRMKEDVFAAATTGTVSDAYPPDSDTGMVLREIAKQPVCAAKAERERDEARAEVRRLVKALRTMHDAADFYVRWGCGVGDEDSGGSSFDRLARAAGEASTVLAGYEVDDG